MRTLKAVFLFVILICVVLLFTIASVRRVRVVDLEGTPVPEPQPTLTTLGIRLQPVIPNTLLTWFTTSVCQRQGESTGLRARIQFARDYGVRWREAQLCGDTGSLEECVRRFGTLNDFFTRRIHPQLTKVTSEDMATHILVSPAECRMHIPMGDKFDIKGTQHSIVSLLGPAESWLPTVSSVAIFRLAPLDYHRVHAPTEGVVMRVEDVAGTLQSVADTSSQVLVENVRRILCLETTVGRIALVKVGATCVGSIRTSVASGDHIQKGQDIGDFAFGGSCVVLVCERAVEWDPRILHHSAAGFETWLRAGTRLGTFPNTV